jgi:hypothetical protein
MQILSKGIRIGIFSNLQAIEQFLNKEFTS